MENQFVFGHHAVYEALKSGRTKRIIYAADIQPARHILKLARTKKISLEPVSKALLDKRCPRTNHQGVAAEIIPLTLHSAADVLNQTLSSGQTPCFILLDSITDPRNAGAILRCAEAGGVHGVFYPHHRSVSLNPTVAKTSSGALEYVNMAPVPNLVRWMEQLKKQGVWTVGLDPEGKPYHELDLTVPLACVVGSEGKGLGTLVKKTCDFLARIPMKGNVASLNVSVACGIFLYEVLRQRKQL